MKSEKVYLDTSVVSHLQQEDVPEKMNDTLELWKHFEAGKFDVYLSQITLDELGACPDPKRTIFREYLTRIIYTKLELTDEVRHLADRIIELKILPPKSRNDSLHIATAIIGGCDYRATAFTFSTGSVKGYLDLRQPYNAFSSD